MAASSVQDVPTGLLTCQICLEPFTEPKLLPCLHTFCTGCLEKFVAEQRGTEDALFCPTCQSKFLLPGGVVAGLKSNVLVQNVRGTVDVYKLLDTKDAEDISCCSCEPREKATHWCLECCEFFCTDCVAAHQRLKPTRGHELLGKDELRERIAAGVAVTTQQGPTCSKHNGEILKFYCKTCREPVCRDCSILKHREHVYDYLPDIVGDIKQTLNKHLSLAEEKIDECTKSKDKLVRKNSQRRQALDGAVLKVTEDADRVIQEVCEAVTREKAAIIEQIKTVRKENSKQLSATTDHIDNTRSRVSTTVEFVSNMIKHGTDFDIVNLQPDVTNNLETILQSTTQRIPDDMRHLKYYPRTKETSPETFLGKVSDFNAKFTTLGTAGRLGPTTLGNHYRGQDHEHLVTLHDGIQHVIVPGTGMYSIEAAGAAAGWGISDSKSARGRGAIVRGLFQVQKGEILKILVGQEGSENKVSCGVGGGGGTFVTKADNTPLIIAGGGGGGRGLRTRMGNSLNDGTVSSSGNRSYGGGNSVGLSGGSEGHGATDDSGYVGNRTGEGHWRDTVYSTLDELTGIEAVPGGGGGGLLTDGGSSTHYGGVGAANGGEGGKAFLNGGEGGRGTHNNAGGGFGGGGGGFGSGGGGGGGGGYSGGGRGVSGVDGTCGGGGGSFNAGSDVSGEDGANSGPGYVHIVREIM
ncbi:uncharacterized protein [Branchiostoma lanceolatum]|uniref:uncharacterized protein n=1 Tax=Branchiostoma lanceolatum TaxID=7740 RepID=UPI00345446DA